MGEESTIQPECQQKCLLTILAHGKRLRRDMTPDTGNSKAKGDELARLVQTAITLGEEVGRLREALIRIQSFPVHSEPVGGAMAMQDIAREALSLNDRHHD